MNRTSGILLPGGDLLVGELIAPAGTRMTFNQSAAPLGWAIDGASVFTDCTSVCRQGSGGTSNAGSTLWSGWNFGGAFNLNAFTLSVAQLPSHNHTVSDPGHVATTGTFITGACCGSGGTHGNGTGGNNVNGSSTTPTNTDATAPAFSINNNGSGSSIQPNYTTPQVKYTDVIIGIRS